MPNVLEFKVNDVDASSLTPAVLKLGRQLLDLSQAELAKLAGVSLRSLVDVEKEERTPMRTTLERLRLALHGQGARFFADEEKMGVFVTKGTPKQLASRGTNAADAKARAGRRPIRAETKD